MPHHPSIGHARFEVLLEVEFIQLLAESIGVPLFAF
jgi:hypothetical protein